MRYPWDIQKSGNFSHYLGSINNSANYFASSTRLDLAVLAASISYIPRLFPEGALAEYGPALGITFQASEVRPGDSYYVPEGLEMVEVGPMSHSCLVFRGVEENKGGSNRSTCSVGADKDSIDMLERVDHLKWFDRRLQASNPDFGSFTHDLAFTLYSNWKKPNEVSQKVGYEIDAGVSEQEATEGYSLTGFKDIQHRVVGATGLFDRDSVWPHDGQIIGMTAVYSKRLKGGGSWADKNLVKPDASKSPQFSSVSAVGSPDYPLSGITRSLNPNEPNQYDAPLYYLWLRFKFTPDIQ